MFEAAPGIWQCKELIRWQANLLLDLFSPSILLHQLDRLQPCSLSIP